MTNVEQDETGMECPSCGGSGSVPIGEHFVSRDMAIDAGDRSLEGQSCGVEYGPCDECGGGGVIARCPSCSSLTAKLTATESRLAHLEAENQRLTEEGEDLAKRLDAVSEEWSEAHTYLDATGKVETETEWSRQLVHRIGDLYSALALSIGEVAEERDDARKRAEAAEAKLTSLEAENQKLKEGIQQLAFGWRMRSGDQMGLGRVNRVLIECAQGLEQLASSITTQEQP